MLTSHIQMQTMRSNFNLVWLNKPPTRAYDPLHDILQRNRNLPHQNNIVLDVAVAFAPMRLPSLVLISICDHLEHVRHVPLHEKMAVVQSVWKVYEKHLE